MATAEDWQLENFWLLLRKGSAGGRLVAAVLLLLLLGPLSLLYTSYPWTKGQGFPKKIDSSTSSGKSMLAIFGPCFCLLFEGLEEAWDVGGGISWLVPGCSLVTSDSSKLQLPLPLPHPVWLEPGILQSSCSYLCFFSPGSLLYNYRIH